MPYGFPGLSVFQLVDWPWSSWQSGSIPGGGVALFQLTLRHCFIWWCGLFLIVKRLRSCRWCGTIPAGGLALLTLVVCHFLSSGGALFVLVGGVALSLLVLEQTCVSGSQPYHPQFTRPTTTRHCIVTSSISNFLISG